VSFDTAISADARARQATAGPIITNLAAGTYKVTLVSQAVSSEHKHKHKHSDDSSDEESNTQDQRQWYVQFQSASGSQVVASDTIDNLATDQKQLIHVVNDSLVIDQDITEVAGIHAAYPSDQAETFQALCASFDRINASTTPPTDTGDQHDTEDNTTWDRSSISVDGYCDAPKTVFTITNTGEYGNGNMDGPSEYRIYRNGTLESTEQFKLEGGESLTVNVAANGDTIRLEADQRPGHPGHSHPRATVEDCHATSTGPCHSLNLDFATLPHGTVINEQYETNGIHAYAIANAGRPNALVVFDTGYTGTPDPDLEVGIGHIAVIPENVNDGNNDELVDVPNDSAHGGTQIYEFTHDRIIHSLTFVDKDNGPAGTITAYNTAGQQLEQTSIPNAGDGSVQTVSLQDVGSVRKLTISYTDSGGLTNIRLGCGEGSPNQPPVARDDTTATRQHTSTVIDALANDNDQDGTLDPTTVTIVNQPMHGTITGTDSNTGALTYLPDLDFFGTDTFTYQVCDNNGLCDTALVTIVVQAPPVANDDAVSTPYQTAVSIDVLANDVDPDGTLDPATVTVVSAPTHGSVSSINTGTGAITYQPSAEFSGVDYLTYQVCDNDGLCDTATVAISVDTPILYPPTAEDDAITTPYQTPVTVNILANDTDSDGFLVAATTAITSAPVHGSITGVNGVTGEITYVPENSFSGIDTFDYQICDNDSLCDTATVTVTVEPRPLIPPIANDDSMMTQRDTDTNIDILENDFDSDGSIDPSSVTIVTSPNNGNITNVNSLNGSVMYHPASGFTGTDTFTYQVCDNDGLCDTATVTIGVTPPPLAPPVANDDSTNTDQDVATVIDILSNDTDSDGVIVPSTTQVITGPAHGSVTNINSATGELTYLPTSGFSGEDTLVYQVCDNDGLCDTTNVTISIQANIILQASKITCTNEADLPNWGASAPDITATTGVDFIATHPNCHPTENWNFQWAPEGTSNPGDNTGVANGNWTSFGPTNSSGVAVVHIPKSQTASRIWVREVWHNGFVQFTGVNDTHDYSAEFYCNTDGLYYDNFEFIDRLASGHSYACIAFNVALEPPVAYDDTSNTPFETPVTVAVLANDTDPDGTLDPGTVTVTVNPNHGTVTNVSPTTGKITYSPATGYSGFDTLDYQVCDNDGLCDTATVTISVGAKPLVPPIAKDDAATTQQNTPVTVAVLANDTDPDGTLDPGTVSVTTPPAHGTTAIQTGDGSIVYTPELAFFGSDNFTYQVCDNDGLCDTAVVTITVLAPPMANDDATTTDQDLPVIVNILANDTDPDGTIDPSTAIITSVPSHGTSTIIDTSTGSTSYTPETGFTGNDTFTYQVCDNDGLCDTAIVTVTVEPVVILLPPTANNDAATTTKNTPVTIALMLNDSDADGTLDPASVTVSSSPTNGTITSIDPSTGEATYQPHTDVTGIDSFIYQVCDNDGLCDTATVTVSVVSPPLIPPVANDDGATTNDHTPITVSVLANDSDTDGFLVPGSLVITNPPLHGTITVDTSTNTVTYTPTIGFSGIDTLTYQICDNDGLCDTAVLNVAVNTLAPPVANDDAASTAVDTPVTIDALGNDSDTDGTLDPTTLTLTSSPLSGTVTRIDPATGAITYAPNAGFSGTDTFIYQVCDNDVLCDTATVTITVTTPPTPPTPPPPLVIPPAGPTIALIPAGETVAAVAAGVPLPGTLTFGANQFVLANQSQPLAGNGVIQATVGVPQTFYLEATGANAASLINTTTRAQYSMVYNSAIKLWAVTFAFSDPGTFALAARVSGPAGSSSREINTVVVSPKSTVTDNETGQPVNALVTVYERDVATGSFIFWDGGALAQQNPVTTTNGAFSVTLPRGQFYLGVTSPGYAPVRSQIIHLEEQGIVSANVALTPSGTLLQQLASLFQVTNTANNFPLQVTKIPSFALLQIGQALPDFQAHQADQADTSLFDSLAPNEPTVLMVYSTWNTLAVQELQIFSQVSRAYDGHIQFVPLSTMEPENLNARYILQGQYALDTYKPTSSFFSDYHITSLPQFIFMNTNHTLAATHTGPLAAEALNQLVEQTFQR